ncbi:MAG TPA: hypothetical protein VNA17_02395 [Pyrinomonadaceae bacterium]|nr:hypothetical protein [Pyrinomonadaceae bacterium]
MHKQDGDFANYDGLRMTLNLSFRRQVLAVPATLLCSLLFAAIVAFLPTSAGAQCSTGWDASGSLIIIQRGSKYANDLTLEQKGKVITGTAYTYTPTYGIISDGYESLKGTVDGTFDGDRFSVQIFWANRLTGIYNGKVLPSGRLDGEAWEKASPNSRQTWHSQGVLKCAPPPPVVPKPIKSSGKAKPAPQPPAPPPPTPPFIIASQAIVPTPTHPFGIVPLSWDGGPDHPSVEVFVSIDNGAEIPAFSTEHLPQSPVWKQPKASIPLHLQRYHHYRFVLKAAGKTLSTAVFVVQ